MIKRLKLFIARKCRQWAQKLAPRDIGPAEIRLESGTLRRERVKALDIIPRRKWDALIAEYGNKHDTYVKRYLTEALGKAIAEALEKSDAVKFETYEDAEGFRTTAETYIFIKHD